MPGLLQTPAGKFASAKYAGALVAEFLGVLLFTWAGTSTPTGVTSTQNSTGTANAAAANWAPWGNGMSLAIVVYVTANVSGGHVNPAVTAATMVTGHIGLFKGLGYIIAQLAGGIFGILLVCGLVPDASIGMGNNGVGCFQTGTDVTLGMLFGWELVMTFVLVSVVYAVAVGEPSFGNVGPFAVGLALFAMVFAGSQYTGTAINPARAFAPAAVYQCYWNQVWVYCIAEFSGGIIAGLIAAPLYGVGAPWLKAVIPWSHPDEEVEGTSGHLVRKKKRRNPSGGNQPQLYQNRTGGQMEAQAMGVPQVPVEQRPVISSKADNAVPLTHNLSQLGPHAIGNGDAHAHMV